MKPVTYNHAFDIAFEVSGSTSPTAEDVTADQLREAITLRIETMQDGELIESVGMPFDTYEEE